MKSRSLVIVTLLIISAVAATAQRRQQERSPIIDVHVHAYGKDDRWRNVALHGEAITRIEGTGVRGLLVVVGTLLSALIPAAGNAQLADGDTVTVVSGTLKLKGLLWRPASDTPVPAVLFH